MKPSLETTTYTRYSRWTRPSRKPSTPKRKPSRYQHITNSDNDIVDNDRTVRCGRIRLQNKFYWLQTRPEIKVHCHALNGRLQICDFVCPNGRSPRTGPTNVKCFFFRDRTAKLTTLKTIPSC